MGFPEVTNINNEAEEVIMAQRNLSFAKLLLLGFFAIALCSFGPMSFFASVPLTMAILLFGRKQSFVMVAMLGVPLFVLTSYFNLGVYLAYMFFSSYFYSVLIGEIFLRKVHPVRGLLGTGAIVLAITFTLIGITILSGVNIQDELTKIVTQTLDVIKTNNADVLAEKGEQARMLEDIIGKPEKVVQRIINWSPAAIIVSNFFIIWACIFILLRNSLFWRIKHSYPYTVDDIVKFKVPDHFVWPLILSLTLTVGGEYLIGESAEIIGGNIMYCLGVFYFFQGFGIYLDFLTFAKIQGLIRSILVIFTVSMAWRFIAIVGIFDFWVNFRKFFKTEKQ